MDTSCRNEQLLVFLTRCNISVEGMLYIKEIFTAERFKYALAWDGQHVFIKIISVHFHLTGLQSSICLLKIRVNNTNTEMFSVLLLYIIYISR